MIIINANTKKGQQMINKAKYSKGNFLSDVYGRYSKEKEKAYNECFKMYLNDVDNNNGKHFSIFCIMGKC